MEAISALFVSRDKLHSMYTLVLLHTALVLCSTLQTRTKWAMHCFYCLFGKHGSYDSLKPPQNSLSRNFGDWNASRDSD